MKHDEIHSYMVIMRDKSQGKFNKVIVWDETRWNQFYVVFMLKESQWKCNIVIVWDET